MIKNEVLNDYAKQIIKSGVNLQQNQDLVIFADLDMEYFVLLLVEQAYSSGARSVDVRWNSDKLTVIKTDKENIETLSSFERWQHEKMKERIKTNPVMLHIESSHPDSMKGIDQNKYSLASAKKYKKIKKYLNKLSDTYQWCIAAAAGLEWSKKVYPDLSDGKAVDALWNDILELSRTPNQSVVGFNTMERWEDHQKSLKERNDKLNKLELKSVHFKSTRTGTDLEVYLNPLNLWRSGKDITKEGIPFSPNIPTEECFGMPSKSKINGIVYATKPLSYNGEMVENFWVRFENGKAVEVGGGDNPELIRTIINQDKNSCYLGEVALVGKSSPIAKKNKTFYTTLIDENASCHLAFGRGFESNMKNYKKMPRFLKRRKGLNESSVHVDFMIGSDDMTVVGVTKDGTEVQIFKDGDWNI